MEFLYILIFFFIQKNFNIFKSIIHSNNALIKKLAIIKFIFLYLIFRKNIKAYIGISLWV